MLERVPASAELAVHLFVRNIERPHRTTKVLDSRFWRNASQNIESTTWWSSYLQSIRGISSTSLVDEDSRRSIASSRGRSSRSQVHLASQNAKVSRGFTTTAGANVTATATPTAVATDPMVFEEEDMSDPFLGLMAEPKEIRENARKRTQSVFNQVQLTFESLIGRVRDVTEAEVEDAWRLFVSLENQANHASDILYLLSHSRSRVHQEKASNAYRLIPIEKRSLRDYQSAIRAELARFKHRSAIDIAVRGALRGHDLVSGLVLHFLEKSLWGSVAELRQAYERSAPLFTTATFEQFETKLTSCAEIAELPQHISALAKRLAERKSVDATYRPALLALCKQLAQICVSSPTIITRIEASELIDILELRQQFQISGLHASAFQTVSESSHPQIAHILLLTYRHWRETAPAEAITIHTLEKIVDACGQAQMPVKVYEYIQNQWESLKLTPPPLLYQRIIMNCARQNDVEAVEKWVKAYTRSSRDVRNVSMFAPLIYVHAVVGDVENAQKAFDRVQHEFGLHPDTTCWNMLLLAHAKSSDETTSFKVFDDMQAAGVRFDSHTFGTMMSTCARHGDVDGILLMSQQAQSMGLALNTHMYSDIVQALLRNNDIKQAFAVAVQASAPRDARARDLTRLWNSLLRHLAFKADTTTTLMVLNQMKQFGVKFDSMTWAALFSAMASQKKTTDAAELLRSMHSQRKMTADAFHYAIIMNGFIREGNRDRATAVYNEMIRLFPIASAKAREGMLTLRVLDDSSQFNDASSPGQAATVVLEHSLEYMASLLAISNDVTTTAKMHTQRSHNQRYLEIVVGALLREQRYADAQRLLSHSSLSSEISEEPSSKLPEPEIRMASYRMELAIEKGEYSTAIDIWNVLFKKAAHIQEKRSTNMMSFKEQPVTSTATENQPDDAVAGPVNGASGVGKETVEVSLMLKNRLKKITSYLPRDGWLPQRYLLSLPMSRYIEAMTMTKAYEELVHFIENDFRAAGFRLSSDNANKYVQTFSISGVPRHRLTAFRYAEKSLIRHAHSWRLLRKGKIWDQKLQTWQRRSSFSRVRPDERTPTYVTMVHLAHGYLQALNSLRKGSPGETEALMDHAPRTVLFVRDMPKIKDRVQGLLMRNRYDGSNFESRPRYVSTETRVRRCRDILGANDLRSSVNSDHRAKLARLLHGDKGLRSSLGIGRPIKLSKEQCEVLAEQIFGRISRSPQYRDIRKRFETGRECRARFNSERKRNLQRLYQLLVEEQNLNPAGDRIIINDLSQELLSEQDLSLLADDDYDKRFRKRKTHEHQKLKGILDTPDESLIEAKIKQQSDRIEAALLKRNRVPIASRPELLRRLIRRPPTKRPTPIRPILPQFRQRGRSNSTRTADSPRGAASAVPERSREPAMSH